MSNYGSYGERESLPPTPQQKLDNKRQEEAAKQRMAEMAAEKRREEDALRGASDYAVATFHDEQKPRQLMILVLGAGHKIWTDGETIFVDPHINPGINPLDQGLYARIAAEKTRLLKLLPSEPQGPQRI